MADLTAQIRELVSRLSRAPAPVNTPTAPVSAEPRPDSGPGARSTVSPVQPPARPDLAALLALPLDRFAHAGRRLGIRVPWWPALLWFVPDEADAEALVAEGVPRGTVWTAAELVDLLAIPGLTCDAVRRVAEARALFDGDLVRVEPRP